MATILSAAMIFDWLGERHNDAASREAANRIETAVAGVLRDGAARTADLGGTASTSEVAEAVIRML